MYWVWEIGFGIGSCFCDGGVLGIEEREEVWGGGGFGVGLERRVCGVEGRVLLEGQRPYPP